MSHQAFFATVFVCSQCQKASPDASNIRRHIGICGDSTACMQKKRARFELLDEEEQVEEVDAPTPFPAFDDDDADDARIEWLFDSCNRSHLLSLLEELDTTRLPAKAYRLLWGGHEAVQPCFQSILLKNKATLALVDSAGAWIHAPLTRDVLCDIAVSLLEFIYSIAKHSVPARVAGDDAQMRQCAAGCLARLCDLRTLDGNMSLRAALKKRKRTAGVRATIMRLQADLFSS